MENYQLVLPEHLNHYGYIFGGNLLKWVDESAWIAATLDYPKFLFVTIAMDKVVFKKSVKVGSILRIVSEKVKQGKTSVQYSVNVYAFLKDNPKEDWIFSTNIHFVRVNEQGDKIPIS